ncbi:MAG: DUF2335 domain-containing protein [Candidatus Sabulitectum sp.]|nr:DUF2335 domain-containing protein [Candidatus Sabulitectum sp.]
MSNNQKGIDSASKAPDTQMVDKNEDIEDKDTDSLAETTEVQSTPDNEIVENSGDQILERLEIEAPDIFTTLGKEQRKKLVSIVATHHKVTTHYRGPLPPPKDIEHYNNSIPDGANRIMTMVETESQHRIEMEKKIVSSQISQSGRGQHYGLILGILGILAGSAVALLGHDWVGVTIAGSTAVSLVYAFISGQRSQRSPE